MEEAFIWLMRLLAVKEMLQDKPTPIVMREHGGCGCGCGGSADLDDMEDLEEGQPYIWNR